MADFSQAVACLLARRTEALREAIRRLREWGPSPDGLWIREVAEPALAADDRAEPCPHEARLSAAEDELEALRALYRAVKIRRSYPTPRSDEAEARALEAVDDLVDAD